MQDDGAPSGGRRPAKWRRWAHRLDAGAGWVIGLAGAALLMVLMLLTAVDVVGRSLGRPIPGAKEATQVMLAGLVFLMLPLVTRLRAHIAVDLMDVFIPPRLRALQEAVICLLGAVALHYGAQALHMQAARAFRLGDRVAFIGVPTGPIVTFMAWACALAALAFALNGIIALWRLWQGHGQGPVDGDGGH